MKALITSLKLVALLSVSFGGFSGCESSGGGSASVSGGVYYGTGFYDPWVYGAGYYPPTVVVPPPGGGVRPPPPERPVARPLPAPAPRPMPSIPSAPRPMPRPAMRR